MTLTPPSHQPAWLHLLPLMPLPSSWKELRCRPGPPPRPVSSRCSLPPLPEDAMLLWGESGAWSGAGPREVRRSSWDNQTWPSGWLLGPLIGGVRDTERFRGLCCGPPPLDGTARAPDDKSGTMDALTHTCLWSQSAATPFNETVRCLPRSTFYHNMILFQINSSTLA